MLTERRHVLEFAACGQVDRKGAGTDESELCVEPFLRISTQSEIWGEPLGHNKVTAVT